jgi:hypothetical protein
MCPLLPVGSRILTLLLSYFEERPGGYLDSKNTCILGRGFGLLSAAAIASCDSLASLTSVAVEVVRIALRTGLRVQSVSERLGTESTDGTWSVTVSNATEIEVRNALSEFYKTHVCICKQSRFASH